MRKEEVLDSIEKTRKMLDEYYDKKILELGSLGILREDGFPYEIKDVKGDKLSFLEAKLSLYDADSIANNSILKEQYDENYKKDMEKYQEDLKAYNENEKLKNEGKKYNKNLTKPVEPKKQKIEVQLDKFREGLQKQTEIQNETLNALKKSAEYFLKSQASLIKENKELIKESEEEIEKAEQELDEIVALEKMKENEKNKLTINNILKDGENYDDATERLKEEKNELKERYNVAAKYKDEIIDAKNEISRLNNCINDNDISDEEKEQAQEDKKRLMGRLKDIGDELSEVGISVNDFNDNTLSNIGKEITKKDDEISQCNIMRKISKIDGELNGRDSEAFKRDLDAKKGELKSQKKKNILAEKALKNNIVEFTKAFDEVGIDFINEVTIDEPSQNTQSNNAPTNNSQRAQGNNGVIAGNTTSNVANQQLDSSNNLPVKVESKADKKAKKALANAVLKKFNNLSNRDKYNALNEYGYDEILELSNYADKDTKNELVKKINEFINRSAQKENIEYALACLGNVNLSVDDLYDENGKFIAYDKLSSDTLTKIKKLQDKYYQNRDKMSDDKKELVDKYFINFIGSSALLSELDTKSPVKRFFDNFSKENRARRQLRNEIRMNFEKDKTSKVEESRKREENARKVADRLGISDFVNSEPVTWVEKEKQQQQQQQNREQTR